MKMEWLKLGMLGLSALMVAPGHGHAQSWNTASDILALGLPVLAAVHTHGKDDGHGLRQLGLTLGSTWASTVALKSQIQAVRPDGSDKDSFPSGHTAIVFASARFMHKRNGDDTHPVALYGVAGMTALARVRAEQHYWRDTVAGAALGYAWAEYFTVSQTGQQVGLLPMNDGLLLMWQQAW